MMFRRNALALVVAGALAFGLTGCLGQPAAKPSTPTPAFTSDAAAYAAAEKVYREYVDALNHVDLADPKTFEPVFALTTGDANAEDRKTFSQMHADGWRVSGDSLVPSIKPRTTDHETGETQIGVCLDVSAVDLVDRDGVSTVEDRADVQSLLVVVVPRAGGYKIQSFLPGDGDPSCN